MKIKETTTSSNYNFIYYIGTISLRLLKRE